MSTEDRPRILKFGGTSVATPASLATLGRLVASAAGRVPVVVVVSAVAGVTDALYDAVRRAAGGEAAHRTLVPELLRLHGDLLEAAGEPHRGEVTRLLHQRVAGVAARLEQARRSRACPPEEAAFVLAAGERLSAPVVAASLRASGLPAEEADAGRLVRTDARFLEAAVDFPATRRLVAAWYASLARGAVPVVTGFLGATASGQTTLLGRGGSDYTAAVLGHALGAERVEIWTDVDGVLSADPRLVAEARPLPRLSYAEAAALAGAGARVLHPRTVGPLAERGIPLLVRNTLRPHGRGTLVGPDGAGRGLRAVTSRPDGDRCTVTLVGPTRRDRRDRVREVLARAGVPVVAPPLFTPPALSVGVAPADGARAVAALHRALVRRTEPVGLVIVGPRGQVARALCRLLLAPRPEGPELRLVGAIDRTRSAWSDHGLDPSALDEALAAGPSDRPGGTEALGRLPDLARPLVLVDATASEEVARAYPALLRAGIAVVTPNKIANSLSYADYRRLRRLAEDRDLPYLYGTTVGAGLPVVRCVRELAAAGDRLVSVRALLSGTLSFVLGRLHAGTPFSRAVAEARAGGLTEPDPRQDLSGEDVARKLLVVLREAGRRLERADLRVESLAPPPGGDLVEALAGGDEAWAGRAARAEREGRRLVHLAACDEDGPRVVVAELPADDRLARAAPGENVVVLRTERLGPVPLTLAGPGAGPLVTATNLLAEVVQAARLLTSVGRRPRQRISTPVASIDTRAAASAAPSASL